MEWTDVEPNSGLSYGALIAKLFIPDHAGPVIVYPVNPDVDVQHVHFYTVLGDKTPIAGRVAKAVPVGSQIVNQNLIDKQKLTATTDENGYAMLTLIRGASYEITLAGWGFLPITVTQDSNRPFSAYVIDSVGIVPDSDTIVIVDGGAA